MGVAILAAAGCYSYQPLVGVRPAPGEDVRVRLSAPAAENVSAITGRTIRSLEARVYQVTPDSLVLDVGWGAVYAGTPFAGRRDTIRLGERDVLELDRRQFSRGRTALVVGGLAAVVVWVFRSLSSGGEGTDPGNGGGPGF